MKTLLSLVLAVTFSQTYAQSYMSSGAPSGGSAPGAVMTSPNPSRPIFDTMNNTKTTSDTVGTTQSSTTTTIKKTKERRVIPITPANTNPSGANCVDRSGRSFRSGDSGYTGCINSMRMR